MADVIREAILAAHLPVGERLTETALAAQLGTSRAPVREALRQLEQEGLVASYPYRSTEVLGVSQEEIENILVPVRIALEQYAFRKVMPKLTEDDYRQLDGLIGAMAKAARDGDLADLVDCDVAFHEAVIVRAELPHCTQIWRSIQPRVRAYFRRDAGYHADVNRVVAQHQELVTALRSGDERQVAEAVEAHIREHEFEPPNRQSTTEP